MKFIILTLFENMFSPLSESILKIAKEKQIIDIQTIDIRKYAINKHKRVDMPPYGGGAGMVIMPKPVNDAYMSIDENIRKNAKVIYLSPKGKLLTQEKVIELSKQENLILLAGHYEGIDQRVLDKIVDEEISIGDYVLTGGELPAMVLIDSISRYIEGVISKESLQDESHTNGLLEYPQYTRPQEFEGSKVPEILLSGNHKQIDEYRKKESLKITLMKRPDLLKRKKLTEKEKKYLEEIQTKKIK